MITADNITDDQIYELRTVLRSQFRTGSPGSRARADVRSCTVALWSDVPNLRARARARCADLINARATATDAVTDDDIRHLMATQSPMTGNCAWLCTIALGAAANTTDDEVRAARARCAMIISARAAAAN